MPKKSNVEELTYVFENLEATTPDSEASAIVSVDGLMIAVGSAVQTVLARKDAKLAGIPGYEPDSRVCNRAHVS